MRCDTTQKHCSSPMQTFPVTVTVDNMVFEGHGAPAGRMIPPASLPAKPTPRLNIHSVQIPTLVQITRILDVHPKEQHFSVVIVGPGPGTDTPGRSTLPQPVPVNSFYKRRKNGHTRNQRHCAALVAECQRLACWSALAEGMDAVDCEVAHCPYSPRTSLFSPCTEEE